MSFPLSITFFLNSLLFLVSLWFPSCPLLFSLSFRKSSCSFFVVYTDKNGVVVPRCPRPDIIADVYFIISPWFDDVVWLRCLLFWTQKFEREHSLFWPTTLKPCKCGLAIEFLQNSVPHQFLEASGIFALPSPPTRKSLHISFLDVLFVWTLHSKFHVEISCKVEVWLHSNILPFALSWHSKWKFRAFPHFTWVCCVNRHHESCSDKNCCTSIFKLPWSLFGAKLSWNQQRREDIFPTKTHISKQFQIWEDIPIRGTCVFVSEQDTANFPPSRKCQTGIDDKNWLTLVAKCWPGFGGRTNTSNSVVNLILTKHQKKQFFVPDSLHQWHLGWTLQLKLSQSKTWFAICLRLCHGILLLTHFLSCWLSKLTSSPDKPLSVGYHLLQIDQEFCDFVLCPANCVLRSEWHNYSIPFFWEQKNHWPWCCEGLGGTFSHSSAGLTAYCTSTLQLNLPYLFFHNRKIFLHQLCATCFIFWWVHLFGHTLLFSVSDSSLAFLLLQITFLSVLHICAVAHKHCICWSNRKRVLSAVITLSVWKKDECFVFCFNSIESLAAVFVQSSVTAFTCLSTQTAVATRVQSRSEWSKVTNAESVLKNFSASKCEHYVFWFRKTNPQKKNGPDIADCDRV